MESIYSWFMSLSRNLRLILLGLAIGLVGHCSCSSEETVAKTPRPPKESSEVIMLRKIDAVLERSTQISDSLDVKVSYTGFDAIEIVSRNHKTLTNVVVALNLNYYYFLEEMLPGVEYTIASSDFLSEPKVYYNRKTMIYLWFNVVCDQGLYGGNWKDSTVKKPPFRLPPRKH